MKIGVSDESCNRNTAFTGQDDNFFTTLTIKTNHFENWYSVSLTGTYQKEFGIISNNRWLILGISTKPLGVTSYRRPPPFKQSCDYLNFKIIFYGTIEHSLEVLRSIPATCLLRLKSKDMLS